MRAFLVFCFGLFAMSSFAGSGKAIIPFWEVETYTNSYIFLVNISNEDLVVSVTWYQSDGTQYSPAGADINYTNWANSNTEIQAGKTAEIRMDPPSATPDIQGYAIIEWSNKGTDETTVGLVCSGYIHFNYGAGSRFGRSAIIINNGMPF